MESTLDQCALEIKTAPVYQLEKEERGWGGRKREAGASDETL